MAPGRHYHKDVKNEGRSGDVYENKGSMDNMPDEKYGRLRRSGMLLTLLTAKTGLVTNKMRKNSVHNIISAQTSLQGYYFSIGTSGRTPEKSWRLALCLCKQNWLSETQHYA